MIFNRGAPLSLADITQASGGDARNPHLCEDASDDSTRAWICNLLSKGGQAGFFENGLDHFGSLLVGEALDLIGRNRSPTAKMLGRTRPILHAKID